MSVAMYTCITVPNILNASTWLALQVSRLLSLVGHKTRGALVASPTVFLHTTRGMLAAVQIALLTVLHVHLMCML